MLLSKSGLIKIADDPATDSVTVDMPHVDTQTLPEVKESLRIFVENVRNYDVKRLLVDACYNEVAVDVESYE